MNRYSFYVFNFRIFFSWFLRFNLSLGCKGIFFINFRSFFAFLFFLISLLLGWTDTCLTFHLNLSLGCIEPCFIKSTSSSKTFFMFFAFRLNLSLEWARSCFINLTLSSSFMSFVFRLNLSLGNIGTCFINLTLSSAFFLNLFVALLSLPLGCTGTCVINLTSSCFNLYGWLQTFLTNLFLGCVWNSFNVGNFFWVRYHFDICMS